MRIVFEVKPAFLARAQDVLSKDDITSRQSIYIRTASSINLKADATYIIFDGNETGVKKATELLKGLAEKAKDQDEILKKFDEIENASAEGFGFLGI